MAGMVAGHALRGAGALASALHLHVSGPVVLAGWVLAGAALAGWAALYARNVCALRPIALPPLTRAAGWGATVTTAVAAAAHLHGPVVWASSAIAAAVWVVLVTPSGQLSTPASVRRGVVAARASVLQ